MPIKTITQIRAETPTVTLTDADLFLMDQATKTVAATLAQLKTFVRPANATTTTAGLMSSADKTKLGQIPAPTDAFAFPKYTFAAKPAASSNNGRYIEITDSADGIVLARSNGTDWVKVAVVSADPVTAAP